MGAGGQKQMLAAVVSASLLVGGCNAQNAKEAGGAIGTLLGVAAGIALGSKGDMGPVGGALIGGMAGFIAGSLVGAVVDEVDRVRQQEATQAALTSGSTTYWASPKNPGKVYGRTEIVEAPAGPVGNPGTQTVVMPANGHDLPAVYCDPGNLKPYRLEAPRCPVNVRQISREQYLAMVPEAAPRPLAAATEPKKAHAQKPKPARVQTASIPTDPPKPGLAVVPEASTQTVCRVAKEVIWIDGKEQVDQIEYCRAPGASAWVKKAA